MNRKNNTKKLICIQNGNVFIVKDRYGNQITLTNHELVWLCYLNELEGMPVGIKLKKIPNGYCVYKNDDTEKIEITSEELDNFSGIILSQINLKTSE